jgi:hypothetical protein
MGRVPEPERSKIHYYLVQDYLARASEQQRWTWCEVRPDAIVSVLISRSPEPDKIANDREKKTDWVYTKW